MLSYRELIRGTVTSMWEQSYSPPGSDYAVRSWKIYVASDGRRLRGSLPKNMVTLKTGDVVEFEAEVQTHPNGSQKFLRPTKMKRVA